MRARLCWPWSSPGEWRAHVPQGERVLPGWEDSVDIAEWLIDPGGTDSRPAHAAGRAGDRCGWRSGAGLGGGCARRSGRVAGAALWRVVRAVGHGARIRRKVMGGSRPLTPTDVGAPGRAARADACGATPVWRKADDGERVRARPSHAHPDGPRTNEAGLVTLGQTRGRTSTRLQHRLTQWSMACALMLTRLMTPEDGAIAVGFPLVRG